MRHIFSKTRVCGQNHFYPHQIWRTFQHRQAQIWTFLHVILVYTSYISLRKLLLPHCQYHIALQVKMQVLFMTDRLTFGNLFLCGLQVDWSFPASLGKTSDPFHRSVRAFYSQGFACTQLITEADQHKNKLIGGFVGTLCPLWTLHCGLSTLCPLWTFHNASTVDIAHYVHCGHCVHCWLSTLYMASTHMQARLSCGLQWVVWGLNNHQYSLFSQWGIALYFWNTPHHL